MYVTQLHAQDRTVTGVVVDNNNQPVVGATVKAVGANNATVTDAEGAFILRIPSSVSNVEITSLGYNSIILAVHESGVLNATK